MARWGVMSKTASRPETARPGIARAVASSALFRISRRRPSGCRREGLHLLSLLDCELDLDGIDRQRSGDGHEPLALCFDGLPGREGGLDVGERGEVLVALAFLTLD